jgi:short-subunit dehydrogenase
MAKTVVITGASSGIGEAGARLFAANGWHVVLVARREERLRELATSLGSASFVAVDLVADDAPALVRGAVTEVHCLVNNAGAAWRGTFADKGFENVQRHMRLNFDAQLRLTEALLPLLRASSPSSIVNVSSVAGRVSRGHSGGYSASKFALAGWSDALYAEERVHGVHVGLVLPGFVSTEGFPQAELREKALTRRLVSTPEVVAQAIWDAGPGGKPERYTPRGYALVPALRTLLPGLIRRAGVKSGAALATRTGADAS